MKKPNHSQDEPLAEELGRLVQALSAAGRAVFPRSADALLRSIVEAAARIFGASAASILLVNEAENVLEFKVAHGAADHDLVGTCIPIDQGIAGYVVMTGQPIAISDVLEDTRFNKSFAQSTGYVPRSILATPLVAGDHVLGVMEVLDKIDASSFRIQDMELLGMFAHQAALAIDQAQTSQRLGEAWVKSLQNLAQADPDHPMENLAAALETQLDPGSREDLFVLAGLLNDFSRLGEPERKTCLKVLAAFAEYGRAQKRPLRRMSRV